MSVTETLLQAQPRAQTGKGVARRLRRAGRIPAIVYGKDMEPIPLSLDGREATHLFESIPVENTILRLDIGGREAMRALVREIQTHPYRAGILHVDFMRVRKGVEVEVNVPLQLSGTPAGARAGGRLEIAVYEAHVRCRPSMIPESIQVDVSGLDVGDSLRLGDIAFADGMELVGNPDVMICHVAAARRAEEEGEEEEPGEEPGGL